MRSIGPRGSIFLPRRFTALHDAPPRREPRHHPLVPQEASVVAMTPTRTNVAVRTDDRHRPGEPARRDGGAEMQLDVARCRCLEFALRGLQIRLGHTEAHPALEPVACAARKDRDARAYPGVAGDSVHTAVLHRERGDARARTKVDARRARLLGEALVERAPIDDDGLDRPRRVRDRYPTGRRHANGFERVQNRRARHAELVEALGAEHTGAVHRVSDPLMFLE